MNDTTKPATKVSLYPVTAVIWRNVSKNGEVFYAVTFERTYRDEGGNWKSSSSFNSTELLLLAKVADLAHTEVLKLRANDKQVQALEEPAA